MGRVSSRLGSGLAMALGAGGLTVAATTLKSIEVRFS